MILLVGIVFVLSEIECRECVKPNVNQKVAATAATLIEDFIDQSHQKYAHPFENTNPVYVPTTYPNMKSMLHDKCLRDYRQWLIKTRTAPSDQALQRRNVR